MNKKWWMLAAVGLVVGALALSLAVPALAQEVTPTVPSTSSADALSRWAKGFGFGKSWASYDAVAAALGLTPVELFTELHAGKTIEEIAAAKGIDLQKVKDAYNAARLAEKKAEIEQAVKDGTITQEQADWMLKGIEQGWMPMGHGGRGHGMRGLPPSGNSDSSGTQSVTPGGTSL